MKLADLIQIKQDRQQGVMICRSTIDKLIDYALAQASIQANKEGNMNTTAELVKEVARLTQLLADSNLALMEQTEIAKAANRQAEEKFDFVAHLAYQAAWSENTFGPGMRTAGVCDHIRKELKEIEADPSDLKEWIDVVILALDGAWRCGGSPQQIIDGIIAKQAKNENRVWPDWRTADPNKAIEHDRSHDASPQQHAQAALREVHAFLLGEGPLEGLQFSEHGAHHKAPYWWRNNLRAAMAAQSHKKD